MEIKATGSPTHAIRVLSFRCPITAYIAAFAWGKFGANLHAWRENVAGRCGLNQANNNLKPQRGSDCCFALLPEEAVIASSDSL